MAKRGDIVNFMAGACILWEGGGDKGDKGDGGGVLVAR